MWISAVSEILCDPSAKVKCPNCSRGILTIEYFGNEGGRPHEARIACTECEAQSWSRNPPPPPEGFGV